MGGRWKAGHLREMSLRQHLPAHGTGIAFWNPMRLYVTCDGKTNIGEWTQTALAVGRSRRCDVHIEDRTASSRHCLLVNLGDGWMVCDSGSRNGTFVNGERVSKRMLAPGDRIAFGHTTIDFEQPAPSGTPGIPASGTDNPQLPAPPETAPGVTAATLPCIPSVMESTVNSEPRTTLNESQRSPEPKDGAAGLPFDSAPPDSGGSSLRANGGVAAPGARIPATVLSRPRLPVKRLAGIALLWAVICKLPSGLLSVAVHAGIILLLSIIVISQEMLESSEPIMVTIAPPAPTDSHGLAMETLTTDDAGNMPLPFPEHAPVIVEEPWSRDSASDVSDASTSDRTPVPITIGTGATAPELTRVRHPGLLASLKGASAERRAAIELGLDWLRRHQAEDGRWECETAAGGCTNPGCAGGGEPHYDVGVTSLSILAFVGAGHTHVDGEHAEVVRRALRFLESQQDPEGCFGARKGKFLYNHAIATYAVARDAYFTRSEIVRPILQRAVDFLAESQSPGKGWRYKVRGTLSDTAETGWAILALVAAEKAGARVPKETLAGARRWIEEVTNETTGHAGYLSHLDRGARLKDLSEKYPVHETMTAVAMTSRYLLGGRRGDQVLSRGAGLLSNDLPKWDVAPAGEDFYYWHQGTLAAHLVGGPWSGAWDKAVVSALVASQRPQGCGAGSWEPDDPWGTVGGRVYLTAMNVQTLEIGLGALNRP